jgi:hypothetical protein
MMSMNVDWEQLKAIHKHLATNTHLTDDTDIIFIMILHDGSIKRSVVKFKDFLKCFWTIADNKDYFVTTLVVQDNQGRVIYRHKQVTNGNEKIPIGGNSHIISRWSKLTPKEKETFLRLTIAQINGYEK